MNKKLRLAIIIAAAITVGVFLYGLVRKTTITSSHPLYLSANETASTEISGGQTSIVIRSTDTKSEKYRFALPTSTVFVSNPNPDGVRVLMAPQLAKTYFPSGKVQSYVLPPGQSLEQWQYQYDGSGVKQSSILTNDQGVDETIMVSPSKKLHFSGVGK